MAAVWWSPRQLSTSLKQTFPSAFAATVGARARNSSFARNYLYSSDRAETIRRVPLSTPLSAGVITRNIDFNCGLIDINPAFSAPSILSICFLAKHAFIGERRK